jgi:RNA polymerase sigma factor (sigma-70 family)
LRSDRFNPDTSIGGACHGFPETRASAVNAVRSGDPQLCSIAHDAIVAAYWKPLYKYIRVKWRKSNEDAKDLTQAFFSRAIEKSFFAGFDPAKSSFRGFLRLCADRFVANEVRASLRQKRSGVALESDVAVWDDPGEVFHREWIRTLFSLSLDALRAEYRHRGKTIQLAVFERYDLSPSEDRPRYDQLAAEFSIPLTQVTNYLSSARRDLRRHVLSTLRQLTATEAEFRSEARAVLGRDAP